MATQKDFRIKNGLVVQNGNIAVSQGTVSIQDQISGDTGQLIITNGQLGDSFMRIGMIGSGTANSHIRTDSTLEFHIGQSATSATPSAFIDTSHNFNIKGNFQIDGVNRIVGTSSYTEFRNPQGVTKLWLGGGSDGTSDPSAYVNGNNFWIRDFNSTVNSVFSSSGLDIKRGDLKLNATTVIDSSRNLQNIGTITSGAITTSNRLTVNAGHTTTRLNLVYDDRTGITDDGNLLAWVSEPGISYEDAGIGANINPSGQYYGRYVDDGYGVYARFRKSNGNFEVWNTQGTSGSAQQQGTARLVLGASGVLNLPTGSLNIRGTEVISGNRNLVNIKTITNSAFTIPNSIGTAGQVLKVPSTGTTLEWGADTGSISGITNFADNRLLTASGSSTINGEADLTWNDVRLAFDSGAGSSGSLGAGGVVGSLSSDVILTSTNRLVLGQGGYGRIYISGSDIDISGNLKIGNVQVINSSRNMSNIGTISSGAITVGTSLGNTPLKLGDQSNNIWATIQFHNYKTEAQANALVDANHIYTTNPASGTESVFNEYGALVLQTRDNGNSGFAVRIGNGNGHGTALFIDQNKNATFAGTISSAKLTVNSGASVSQFHSHHSTIHDDWQVSPISIRERGLNGNNSTNNQYSPNLNFHWLGVVSRSLTMTSDGAFTLGEWTSSGTPSMSSSLSFLNTAGYRVNNTNVIDSSRNISNIGTISTSNTITTSVGSTLYGLDIIGSSSSYTAAAIKNTGTGDAILWFDASNGDLSGSDYASVRQNNNLEIVLRTEANGQGISFQTKGLQRFRISGGGTLELGSSNTAILDQSRNLQNIGTISSGAITATNTTNAVIAKYNASNYSALRYDGVDTVAGGDGVYRRAGSEKLRLSTSGISVTGTISSGAITSTSSITGRTGTFTGQNGTALVVNSGTTNVTSTFESGDATAWINIKDSNSSTYGAMLGAEGGLFRLRTNNNDDTTDLTVDTSGNLSVSGTITTTGDVQIGASNVAGNHALEVYHTDNFEAAKFATNQLGSLARFTNASTSIEIGNQSGEAVFRTGSTVRLAANANGDVRIATGHLQMGSTTVITSSRNLQNIGTISSGAITATNISVGNSTGNTRSVIDGSATYYSYYNTETSPRIQLGRDIGVAGGAGLALGGNNSYALIGTNNTSGSAMYFKTASSVATVTTNPDMTLNSSGNLFVRGTISSGAITSTGLNSTSGTVQFTDGGVSFDSSDADGYPRFSVTNGSAQLGLFRTGGSAGGMYIGGSADGFRVYTTGFAQKLLVDQSGNATFAGTISSGEITSSGAIGNRGSQIGQQLELGDTTTATLRFDSDNWRLYSGGTGSSGEVFTISQTGNATVTGNLASNGNISGVLGTFAAPNAVTGSVLITGGKTSVTSVGEINSELNFGSNDGSATGGIGGSIKSITEYNNGARVGMGFYTGRQGRSPYLQEAVRISNDGNLNLKTGALQINGTTVIDSSRNLTNIGTISSGTITVGASHTIGDVSSVDDNFLIASADNKDLTIKAGVDSSTLRLKTTNTALTIDSEGLVTIEEETTINDDLTINATTPSLNLVDTNNNSDYAVNNANGVFQIFDKTNDVSRLSVTSAGNATFSGNITTTSGQIVATTSGDNPLQLNRTSSDGTIILLQQDGVNHGVIGGQEQQTNAPELYLANGLGSNSVGLAFWDYIQTARIAPCNGLGAYKDNYIDLGASSARFDDIYATNGTINTSDRNEKQDIQALTDAEQRVATACKGLIRRFRWQDSVAEKDDNSDSDETARYHFGVIAQDLQDAFTAEGLDASDYGMFISSTWEDDDGVEQTRLGVRYNELLAFIITTI